MKIKISSLPLLLVCVLIAGQVLFGMELTKNLKPIDTIDVGNNFTIQSVVWGKDSNTIDLLLSKENKIFMGKFGKKRQSFFIIKNRQYLSSYNCGSKRVTINSEPIIFDPIDTDNAPKSLVKYTPYYLYLPKNIGPYALHYTNNTISLWKTATQEHFCNLTHDTPITFAVLNKAETKMITASSDGLIKIWQLIKPMVFKCGQELVPIDDNKTNRAILNQLQTFKDMLTDLGDAEFDSELSLYGIDNKKEFDNFFRLMEFIYKKNFVNIEKKLNQLNVNQLCLLASKSSFHGLVKGRNLDDVASVDINLTYCISEIIAKKYNPKKDRFDIKKLSFDLQNIIARYRVSECLAYIDKNSKPLCSFKIPVQVHALEVMSGGEKVKTQSYVNEMKIWDIQTGECISISVGGIASKVSFTISSSDGKIFIKKASPSVDLCVGKNKYKLSGHADEVLSADFSSDGKKIVTGSRDKTAKIWDVQTGICLCTLTGHTDWVTSVRFSLDGRRVTTASRYENVVKIWDIENASKEEFLNNLTIEQADLLTEKMYPVIKNGLKCGLIKNSELQLYFDNSQDYITFMTISPKAQEYFKDYIDIIEI